MLSKPITERVVGAVAALLGGTFVIAALVSGRHGSEASGLDLAPSTIVAGVAGLALLVAAAGLFAHRRWGWGADIGAHLVGIGAALVTLFGVAADRGEGIVGGVVVSGALLLLLVLSLVVTMRVRPRHPLRRARHRVAARLY